MDRFYKLITRASFLLLIFCTTVIGVLIAQIGFNTRDDIFTMHYIRALEYSGIFTEPYLNLQQSPAYRPLLSLIQRGLYDVFGLNPMAFRSFIFLGFSLFMWQLNALMKQLNVKQLPRTIVLFFTLSSPFLYDPKITLGHAASTVLIIGFVILLRLACLPLLTNRQAWAMLGLTVTAPFFVEFGILYYPVTALTFLRHKQWRYIPVFGIGLVVYFWLRTISLDSALSPALIPKGNGYWFTYYTVEELNQLFEGRSVIPFYLYNIVGQFCALLFSQPNHGLISLLPFWELKVFRLILYPLTTFTILFNIRKTWSSHSFIWILCSATILLNCVISYAYSRPRLIMFAGIAYAVLFAISLSALWMAESHWKKRFVIVLLLGWIVNYGNIFYHIIDEKRQVEGEYKTLETVPGPENETYQDARQRFF